MFYFFIMKLTIKFERSCLTGKKTFNDINFEKKKMTNEGKDGKMNPFKRFCRSTGNLTLLQRSIPA